MFRMNWYSIAPPFWFLRYFLRRFENFERLRFIYGIQVNGIFLLFDQGLGKEFIIEPPV